MFNSVPASDTRHHQNYFPEHLERGLRLFRLHRERRQQRRGPPAQAEETSSQRRQVVAVVVVVGTGTGTGTGIRFGLDNDRPVGVGLLRDRREGQEPVGLPAGEGRQVEEPGRRRHLLHESQPR